MGLAVVDQDGTVVSLRRRWWSMAVLYLLVVWLGYHLLHTAWNPPDAKRWAALATCVLAYELWFFRRELWNNRRRGEARLLPTLGMGNALTLVRGLAIGVLAGFLFAPWPSGRLAWIPGILYTLAAIGDYLDGFLSRITQHTTELGKNLDGEVDALGMMIATALAVQYGQLPVWYLSLGLAHYLFVLGIWWRKRWRRPVYELPPSINRRVIGGFQAGFISVVLWPLFSPPSTSVAGMLFAVPLFASFARDWGVVSGWIDPTSPQYLETKQKITVLTTWWLPVVLRTLVVVVALRFITAAFGSWSDWGALCSWSGIPASRPVLVSFAATALLATAMLVLGAAGRVAALGLLVIVCIDILGRGFQGDNGPVLAGTIAIMLLGTGAFSLWRPEDALLSRHVGERTQ